MAELWNYPGLSQLSGMLSGLGVVEGPLWKDLGSAVGSLYQTLSEHLPGFLLCDKGPSEQALMMQVCAEEGWGAAGPGRAHTGARDSNSNKHRALPVHQLP